MTKPKSTTPQAAKKPEPKISPYMRSKLNALIKACEIDLKAPALVELEKAILKVEQKLESTEEARNKVTIAYAEHMDFCKDELALRDVKTSTEEWDVLTMGDRREYIPPEMADAEDDQQEDAEDDQQEDADDEDSDPFRLYQHPGLQSLDQDAFKQALKNFVQIGKFKSEEYGPVFIRASVYPDSKCLCVTVETDEDGVLEYLSINPSRYKHIIPDPTKFPIGGAFSNKSNLQYCFLCGNSASELFEEARKSFLIPRAGGHIYRMGGDILSIRTVWQKEMLDALYAV